MMVFIVSSAALFEVCGFRHADQDSDAAENPVDRQPLELEEDTPD
jgi:hypothetical protein